MTTELIESSYTTLATELTTQTTLLSILANTLEQVTAEPESGFRDHLVKVLSEQLERSQALVSDWSAMLTRKIAEPIEEKLGFRPRQETAEVA